MNCDKEWYISILEEKVKRKFADIGFFSFVVLFMMAVGYVFSGFMGLVVMTLVVVFLALSVVVINFFMNPPKNLVKFLTRTFYKKELAEIESLGENDK